MYLVDTSVWLAFFRGRRNEAVRRFDDIIEQRVPFGINGIIYQEVLQGAASEEEFSRLAAYLGPNGSTSFETRLKAIDTRPAFIPDVAGRT